MASCGRWPRSAFRSILTPARLGAPSCYAPNKWRAGPPLPPHNWGWESRPCGSHATTGTPRVARKTKQHCHATRQECRGPFSARALKSSVQPLGANVAQGPCNQATHCSSPGSNSAYAELELETNPSAIFTAMALSGAGTDPGRCPDRLAERLRFFATAGTQRDHANCKIRHLWTKTIDINCQSFCPLRWLLELQSSLL